jgi:ribosome maturation factor RimP
MTKVYDRERELHREVAETVESSLPDVEVLAVELGGPELLWIFIDHPAGVDHALCAQVTHVLRDLLARYTVNVSSPGIERPLRTPTHFARAVGRRVAVKTAYEISGRKRFRGEIVEAREAEFTLLAGADERVSVPYDAVARGNLIDEGRSA